MPQTVRVSVRGKFGDVLAAHVSHPCVGPAEGDAAGILLQLCAFPTFRHWHVRYKGPSRRCQRASAKQVTWDAPSFGSKEVAMVEQ